MRAPFVWLLFAILFLASFDMHAQMPLLSPYAHSLGASAMMIGVLLGAYSMSNLAGNLIAGPLLDRYSKKGFIATGLLLAGWLLAGHGFARDPAWLVAMRLALGFVMAFVTPACFAMLGQSGRGAVEQGKLMAQNGIVMTAASIVSPTVGGLLAVRFGYSRSFLVFGAVMMLASLFALLYLPNRRVRRQPAVRRDRPAPIWQAIEAQPSLYVAYLGGFALMYAQGTLLYEIPLLIERQGLAPTVTGVLFSCLGIGSLVTLSQFWLQRISPLLRVIVGLFSLGLVLYAVAVGVDLSLYAVMVLVGACVGLMFPAMSTVLTQGAPDSAYGSAFSLLSAVLSVGHMTSPLVAGAIPSLPHAFFIAYFVVTGAGVISLGLFYRNRGAATPIAR